MKTRGASAAKSGGIDGGARRYRLIAPQVAPVVDQPFRVRVEHRSIASATLSARQEEARTRVAWRSRTRPPMRQNGTVPGGEAVGDVTEVQGEPAKWPTGPHYWG